MEKAILAFHALPFRESTGIVSRAAAKLTVN